MAHKNIHKPLGAQNPSSSSRVDTFRFTKTDDKLIHFFNKIDTKEDSSSMFSQIKLQKKQIEPESLNDFNSHISHYDMLNKINVSGDISPDSTGKNTLSQFDYIIPSSYNSVFYKNTDISTALSYIEKVKFEYLCKLELDIKFMKYIGFVGGYLVIYGACLFSGNSILKMILEMNLGDLKLKKQIITSLLKIAQWTNISSTSKNITDINNTIQTYINKIELADDDEALQDIMTTKEVTENVLHEKIKNVFYEINKITDNSSIINVPTLVSTILSQSSNIYIYISILKSEWNFLSSTSNSERFKSTLSNILFHKSPYIHILKRGNNSVSQILKLTNLNNNALINQVSDFVFNSLQNNLSLNNSFNKFVINTLTEKIYPENIVKDQFFDSEDADKDKKIMNQFNAQKLRSEGYTDKQVNEEFVKYIDEQVYGKKKENEHVYNTTELMNLVKVGFPLFFSVEYFNVMYQNNNNNELFNKIKDEKNIYERANIFIFMVYDYMMQVLGGPNVLKLYIYKNFMLTFRNALITTYHKIKNVLIKINTYFSQNSETYNMFITWLNQELIYNISISSIVSAFSDFFFNQSIHNTFENLRQLLMITPIDSESIISTFVEKLNILRYSFNQKNLTQSLNLIFNEPTQFCYINLMYAILFGNAPHAIWSKFPLLRDNFYKLDKEKDKELLNSKITYQDELYRLEKLGDININKNIKIINIFEDENEQDYLPTIKLIEKEEHRNLLFTKDMNDNSYSYNVILDKDTTRDNEYIFDATTDFVSIQNFAYRDNINGDYINKIKAYFYSRLHEKEPVLGFKKKYDECIKENPFDASKCNPQKKELEKAYENFNFTEPLDFTGLIDSPIAIIEYQNEKDGKIETNNMIGNHIEWFIALKKFLKTESILKDKNVKIKFNTKNFININNFCYYITIPKNKNTIFRNINEDIGYDKLKQNNKENDCFMILSKINDSKDRKCLKIEDLMSGDYYDYRTKKFKFDLNTDLPIHGLLLENVNKENNVISIQNDITSYIIKQLQLSNNFLDSVIRPSSSMFCILQLYKIIDYVEKNNHLNTKYDDCIHKIFNISEKTDIKKKLIILNNISNKQSYKDLIIKNEKFKNDYYELIHSFGELFDKQMEPQVKNSLRNNDISKNTNIQKIKDEFNLNIINNSNFNNLNIPLLNNIQVDNNNKLIQYQKRTLYDLILIANEYKINDLSFNEIINKIVKEQDNETLSVNNAEELAYNLNLIIQINENKKFLKDNLLQDINNLIDFINRSKISDTLNNNEINNEINNLLFRIKLAFNQQRNTLLSKYRIENIKNNSTLNDLINIIEKQEIIQKDLDNLKNNYSIDIPEGIDFSDISKKKNNNKLIDKLKCNIYDMIECLLINDKKLIQKCIIHKKWNNLKNNPKKMVKKDNFCLKKDNQIFCKDNLEIPNDCIPTYKPELLQKLNQQFGITNQKISNNIFETYKISQNEASIQEIDEIYVKLKNGQQVDMNIVISTDNYIVQGSTYFLALKKIIKEGGDILPLNKNIIQINEKANNVLPLLAYLDKKINIDDTFIQNIMPITKGEEKINPDTYQFIDEIFKHNNNVFRSKEKISEELEELKKKLNHTLTIDRKLEIEKEIAQKIKEIEKLNSLVVNKDKKDNLLQNFTIDKSFEFFCEKNPDLFKKFLTSAIYNYDNFDDEICENTQLISTILKKESFLINYINKIGPLDKKLICKKQFSTMAPKHNIDFETYFKSYFISHYVLYIKNSIVFDKNDEEYKNGEKQNISILKMLDVMEMLSNYRPDDIFKSCIEFNRKLNETVLLDYQNKFTETHFKFRDKIFKELLPKLTEVSYKKRHVLEKITEMVNNNSDEYIDIINEHGKYRNIITAYITELYKILDLPFDNIDNPIHAALGQKMDDEIMKQKIHNNLHKLIGVSEDKLNFIKATSISPIQTEQNKKLFSDIKLCITQIKELFNIKSADRSVNTDIVSVKTLEKQYKKKEDEKKKYAHDYELLKYFLKLDQLLYGELIETTNSKELTTIIDEQLGIQSTNIENNLSLSMIINNFDSFDKFIKYINSLENNINVIDTTKINMKKYVQQVIDDAHEEVSAITSQILPFNLKFPSISLPTMNESQVRTPFLKNTYDVSLQDNQTDNSQMTAIDQELSLHQANMNLQSNLNKIRQKQTNKQQNIQANKQTVAQANKQTLKTLLKFAADDDDDTQLSSIWGQVSSVDEGLNDDQDGAFKINKNFETHQDDFDYDPEGIIDCNMEDMYFFEGNPGEFRSSKGDKLLQSDTYLKKCIGDWKFDKFFKKNIVNKIHHYGTVNAKKVMAEIVGLICRLMKGNPIAERICAFTVNKIFKTEYTIPDPNQSDTSMILELLALFTNFNACVVPFLKSQNDLYENYLYTMEKFESDFNNYSNCPDNFIDEHDMNGVKNLCYKQLHSYAWIEFMCRQNILKDADELKRVFVLYNFLKGTIDLLPYKMEKLTLPELDTNGNLFKRVELYKKKCDERLMLYPENIAIKDSKINVEFIQNLSIELITNPNLKKSIIKIIYCLLKENKETFDQRIFPQLVNIKYLFEHEHELLFKTHKLNINCDEQAQTVDDAQKTDDPIYDKETEILKDLLQSIYNKVHLTVSTKPTVVGVFDTAIAHLQTATLFTNSLYSSIISNKNNEWDNIFKESDAIRSIFFGNPKYSRAAKAYQLSKNESIPEKKEKNSDNDSSQSIEAEYIQFNFFQQFLLNFNEIVIDNQYLHYISKKQEQIKKILLKINEEIKKYDLTDLDAFNRLDDMKTKVDCVQRKSIFFNNIINDIESEKKNVSIDNIAKPDDLQTPTDKDKKPMPGKKPILPEKKEISSMTPEELKQLEYSLSLFKNDFYDYTCYNALEKDLQELQNNLTTIKDSETVDHITKSKLISLHSSYLTDIYDVNDINSIENTNSNIFKELDLTLLLENKDFKNTFILKLFENINCSNKDLKDFKGLFNDIYKKKTNIEDCIKIIEKNGCNFIKKEIKYSTTLNILTNMLIPKFTSHKYTFVPEINYTGFTLNDNKIFVESLYKLYIKNINKLTYIDDIFKNVENDFLKKNINGKIIEIPFEQLNPNNPNSSLITLWVLNNFRNINTAEHLETKQKILSDNITIENFFNSVKQLSYSYARKRDLAKVLVADVDIIELFKNKIKEKISKLEPQNKLYNMYKCLQDKTALQYWFLISGEHDLSKLRKLCITPEDNQEFNQEFNELLISVASEKFLAVFKQGCKPDNDILFEFNFNVITNWKDFSWNLGDSIWNQKNDKYDDLCATKIWHHLNVIFIGHQQVPFIHENNGIKPKNPNFLFKDILNENYNTIITSTDRTKGDAKVNSRIFKDKAFIPLNPTSEDNISDDKLLNKNHIIYKHLSKIFFYLHKNILAVPIQTAYYFDYMKQPQMNKIKEWFSRVRDLLFTKEIDKFHKFIKDTELKLASLIIRSSYKYFNQNPTECNMVNLQKKIIEDYYDITKKQENTTENVFIDMFLTGPFEDFYEEKKIKEEFYNDNSNIAYMLKNIGINCQTLKQIDWSKNYLRDVIDNIFNNEQSWYEKAYLDDNFRSILERLIGTHKVNNLYEKSFFDGLGLSDVDKKNKIGIIYDLYNNVCDLRSKNYQLNFYDNDGNRTDDVADPGALDDISINDRKTFPENIYKDINEKISYENRNLNKINMNIKFGLVIQTLDNIFNNNNSLDNIPPYPDEIKSLIENMNTNKYDINIVKKNIKEPLFKHIKDKLNICYKDQNKKEIIWGLLGLVSKNRVEKIDEKINLSDNDIIVLMQDKQTINIINKSCNNILLIDRIHDIQKNYTFLKMEIVMQFFINNLGTFTKAYKNFLDTTYDDKYEIRSCLMGFDKPVDYQYMLKEANNILSIINQFQLDYKNKNDCRSKFGLYYKYLMEHIHLFMCLTKIKIDDKEISLSDMIVREYFNRQESIPNFYKIFDENPEEFEKYKISQLESKEESVTLDELLDKKKEIDINSEQFMYKNFDELYKLFNEDEKNLRKEQDLNLDVWQALRDQRKRREEEERLRLIQVEERKRRMANLFKLLNDAGINDNAIRHQKAEHVINVNVEENQEKTYEKCSKEIIFKELNKHKYNTIFEKNIKDENFIIQMIIYLKNERKSDIVKLQQIIDSIKEINQYNDTSHKELIQEITNFMKECQSPVRSIIWEQTIEKIQKPTIELEKSINKLIDDSSLNCNEQTDLNNIDINITKLNKNIISYNNINDDYIALLKKLQHEDNGLEDELYKQYNNIKIKLNFIKDNLKYKLSICIDEKKKKLESSLKSFDKKYKDVFAYNHDLISKLEEILFQAKKPDVRHTTIDYNDRLKKYKQTCATEYLNKLDYNDIIKKNFKIVISKNPNERKKYQYEIGDNFYSNKYYIYDRIWYVFFPQVTKGYDRKWVSPHYQNIKTEFKSLTFNVEDIIKKLNDKIEDNRSKTEDLIKQDLIAEIKNSIQLQTEDMFGHLFLTNDNFKLIDILKQKECESLLFDCTNEGEYHYMFDYHRFRNVIVNIKDLSKITLEELKEMRDPDYKDKENNIKKHQFSPNIFKLILNDKLIESLEQYQNINTTDNENIKKIIDKIKIFIKKPTINLMNEIAELLKKEKISNIYPFDNQIRNVTEYIEHYKIEGNFINNLNNNQEKINTFKIKNYKPEQKKNFIKGNKIQLKEIFNGFTSYNIDNSTNRASGLEQQDINFTDRINVVDINHKKHKINLIKFLDINLNLNIHEKVLKILNINRGPIPLSNKVSPEKSVFTEKAFDNRDTKIYNSMTTIIQDFIDNPDKMYNLFFIDSHKRVILQLNKDTLNLTDDEFILLKNHFIKNSGIYNTTIMDNENSIFINFQHFNDFIQDNMINTFYTILQELFSTINVTDKELDDSNWRLKYYRLQNNTREEVEELRNTMSFNFINNFITEHNEINLKLKNLKDELDKKDQEKREEHKKDQKKKLRSGGGIKDTYQNDTKFNIDDIKLETNIHTSYEIDNLKKIFIDSENRNFENEDNFFQENIDIEKPMFIMSITHGNISYEKKNDYKSIELSSQILDIGQIICLRNITQIDDKDKIISEMFETMHKCKERQKSMNTYILPKNYKLYADYDKSSLREGLYIRYTTNDELKLEKILKILDNEALLNIFQNNHFTLEQLCNVVLIYLKEKNIEKPFYFGSYTYTFINDIEPIVYTNYNQEICGLTWSLSIQNIDNISYIPFDTKYSKKYIHKALDNLFVDIRLPEKREICDLNTIQNKFTIPYFIFTQFYDYLLKNIIHQQFFYKLNSIEQYLSIMNFMFNNYKFKNIMIDNINFTNTLSEYISNYITSFQITNYTFNISLQKNIIFLKINNIDITDAQFSLENYINTRQLNILDTYQYLLKGNTIFKTEDIVLESQKQSGIHINIISNKMIIQKLVIQLHKYIHEDNETIVKDNKSVEYKNIQFFYMYLFEYIMLIHTNLSASINNFTSEIRKIINNINNLSSLEIYKKHTKESYLNPNEEIKTEEQIIINAWSENIFMNDIQIEEHDDCNLIHLIEIIENKKQYHQKLSTILENYDTLVNMNKLNYITEVRKIHQNFITDSLINKYYELKQAQLYNFQINLRKLKELQEEIKTNIIQKIQEMPLYKETSDELSSLDKKIYYTNLDSNHPALSEYLLNDFYPKLKVIIRSSYELEQQLNNFETSELAQINEIYKKHYQKYIFNIVKNKTKYQIVS